MLREMSLTIALLFISSGVLTNAQSAGEGEGAGASEARDIQEFPVVYYDIHRNLSLVCPLDKSDTYKFVWKKNAQPLEEIAMLKDRYTLENGDSEFKLKGKAGEEDYGNYTCGVASLVHQWVVRARAVARVPENTKVVENQKIKLVCKVIGKPTPAVWWTYNETADSNMTKLENLTRDGRIVLGTNEQGVPGAALELDAAVRADAGLYSCHVGDNPNTAFVASTTLRVVDMYAALWPFLGICAEVFVLCAIILVYEKRRTKPELDDSDTDNHDQKKS